MQIKSASELRATWPEMSDKDKLKAAKLMYGNGAETAVQLLNKALGDTEAPVDESNPFTDARMNAIKANKDTFTVGGKTYKVTGDTSDEEKAVQEAELNEVAPAAVAAVIWILKWVIKYGAWPVLKWLLKKHGGKIFGGAAAAYYIDQGWDWVKNAIGEEYAQLLIDNKFEIGMAVALILGAVALKKYMEKQGEKLVRANESMIEKAPPGREKQVKALKKKFDDPGAPYAIAWAQHNKKKSRA